MPRTALPASIGVPTSLPSSMRQRRIFPSSSPLTMCFPSTRTATILMLFRPSITIGFASFRSTILEEGLFSLGACVLISIVPSIVPQVLTIPSPEACLGRHSRPGMRSIEWGLVHLQSRRVTLLLEVSPTAYVVILKPSHWLVSSKRPKKVHLGHANRVPSTKCAVLWRSKLLMLVVYSRYAAPLSPGIHVFLSNQFTHPQSFGIFRACSGQNGCFTHPLMIIQKRKAAIELREEQSIQ
ncbi:hypothetical protein HD554DRAFT_1758570 [Boletus coccyginus]|nr:hypothetical protein HD554DRAFT_1758570 [Boletus coccyginus]